MAAFIGIDVGTSGTKILAIDHTGRVLASGSQAYPLSISTPKPGWMEQDPAVWWQAVCTVLPSLLTKLPGGASAVEGVSLSGHMSSIVPVDEAGEPLRPCILLADTRGPDVIGTWSEAIHSRIRQLTGGAPGAAGMTAKLVWLKRHEPAVYERMRTFLTAKDFVRLQLTGVAATEPTDAGNTMVLDLLARQWDLDLCREMGLDPAKLPELVDTTAIAGRVTREAAAATGLLEGTPVVAGGADMATCTVGAGVVRPGVVGVTIGTAAQVTTAVNRLYPEAAGRLTFHPHAQPGWLYLMGSIFSGGLSLRWLAHALGEDEELARMGNAYFERLSSEAATAPAGSRGAVFLPLLAGSGSPQFDGTVRGSMIGLSLGAGRAELVRAVMEGVAHNARECVDVLTEMNLPVERVHMGSGGSVSPVWRRIVAGMLGRPVYPLRVPDASALGAAVFAAVGTGGFSDVASAADALVSYEDPVEPDPADVAQYERDHQVYVSARLALNEIYRLRAAQE